MPTSEDRFRNRRRMAWMCLLGGVLGFPAFAILSDAETVRALVAPFYAFTGIVVTAYVGAASYEHTR